MMRTAPPLPTRAGRAATTLLAAVLASVAGCAGPAAPGPDPDLSRLFVGELPAGYERDRQVPEDNPITPPKVALGMLLYFDARLSADGTVSCVTCHDPARHYTDGRPTSAGINGQVGARNAPTVINATYMYKQFWDGRADSLEEQALGPIENPIEMGNSLAGAVATLQGIEGYARRFREVFGDEVNAEDIGRAIAAFERTILSGDSAWDRYNRGETTALSESARRGWELFTGKANCSKCHAGYNLSDSDFHNIGIGMDREDPDLGRFEVTGEDADRGAFKTPSLRDIRHTGPYMHDGGMATLEEVIGWYDKGGHPNPWLDAQIFALGLTDGEKADLLAFMNALDGADVPVDLAPPVLPQ